MAMGLRKTSFTFRSGNITTNDWTITGRKRLKNEKINKFFTVQIRGLNHELSCRSANHLRTKFSSPFRFFLLLKLESSSSSVNYF